MIKVEIDIAAIDKVRSFQRLYPGELKTALYDGLNAIALEIHRTAVERLKETDSVDLGQLWNSINIHRISATEVIVGTNAEYAAAVEFGTQGHWITIDKIPGFRGWLRRHGIDPDDKLKYFYVHPKPRPYMEPAYHAGLKVAAKEIQDAIELAISKVGL